MIDVNPLPDALQGRRRTLRSERTGLISFYEQGPRNGGGQPPLLLIHSISAASSAYDVKPIYDHYAKSRRVYAMDLPGFGLSEHEARRYTPRLMTDAITAMLRVIRRENGETPIDAMALSLSCEFLARAAVENNTSFRTVGFVNPTGFEKPQLRFGPGGKTRGSRWLQSLLMHHGWGRGLYSMLTRPAVIRYFLRRAFGSPSIDPGLFLYDVAASRVEGAEWAPISFLSGFLFSQDSGRAYRRLRLPVWMIHGTRGSFAKFPGIAALDDRPNWSIDVLETGAFPHFEQPAEFFRRYDSWIAAATRPSKVLQFSLKPVATSRRELRALGAAGSL